jgi:hypothetical protein
MNAIDLPSKARPVAGRIEHYWFEKAHTGLRVFLRWSLKTNPGTIFAI